MTGAAGRRTAGEAVLFYGLSIIAAGLSIFQIWTVLSARLGATLFRPIHLTWVLVLAFFRYPVLGGSAGLPPSRRLSAGSAGRKILRALDPLLALSAVVSGVIILSFDYNDFTYLTKGLRPLHLAAAVVFFLLVIEAARRAVGGVMAALVSLFVLYNLLGHLLSGRFSLKAYSLSEFLSFQVYSTNGVFGLPLGIAAGVVFVFILFGALLESSRAGDFFTDISFALTGGFRGGPAKASVLASALLGSISGSAIANAVTTGTFTIPLMKKLGYRGEQAAGIEAAASTGGQIMPPVMGAGAFIMAQFTGIPYGRIVIICFVPAVLYFLSTLLYVHIMACKLGLVTSGGGTRQDLFGILRSGWYSLLIVAAVLGFLAAGFTPALVGILGCGAAAAVGFLSRRTRMKPAELFGGLKKAAHLALPVSLACAAAGIIVGVVGQTGLGIQITGMILSLSGGLLISLFLFTALIALFLGMGLPVTASYILLSIVSVPVFLDFGIPLIAAHICIFWLSQTSNVTPPIALAAFAAAGVAKSNPMRSSLQAFKLSNGLLVIPLMMLFNNLLYTGEVGLGAHLGGIVLTLLAVLGIATAVEGRMFFRAVPPVVRILTAAAAAAVIFGPPVLQWGAGAWIILTELINFRLSRRDNSNRTHS